MNDDYARQQFREALELNGQLEKGEAQLLPPFVALAKCYEWINEKKATTGSAKTLREVLLSLANQQEMNLSGVRSLDPERRIWVASVVVGLTFLNDTELMSAAGRWTRVRLSHVNGILVPT